MRNYYREFPQDDGSVKICEKVDGVILPTRYVKSGDKAKPSAKAPAKEVRRITPQKKQRTPSPPKKCKHLGDPTSGVYPPKDGLGDAVERGLSACGITKERWASAKAAFRLTKNEADCSGCEKRQQMLNHLGQSLGMTSKSAEISRLLNLEEGKPLTVSACEVHGVCVTAGDTRGIEGAPHSCTGCKDRVMVDIISIQPPAQLDAQAH